MSRRRPARRRRVAKAPREPAATGGPRTLRLRGTRTESSVVRLGMRAEGVTASSKGRIELAAARDAAGVADLAGVRDHDAVCVEYANGFKQWLRADDLKELFIERASRSGGGEGVVELEPRPTAEAGERGIASLAVKALEVFGVDLKGIAADKLASWFEARQLAYREKSNGRGEGLYRVKLDDDFALQAVTGTLRKPKRDEPVLLFIHGTASSTKGGFGDLWSTETKGGKDLRQALKSYYGEHVYAYEHRTLTLSPIDNALDLVERLDGLPRGAPIHLLTHSRGGLIGELLSLAQRDTAKGDPLRHALLDAVYKTDPEVTELLNLSERDEKAYAAAYATQRKRLTDLLKLLDASKLRVSRFVRVACPARGTTLASGRLDRWLSVLQFLAPEAFGDALDFLLGVVEKRTDPRTLPGLEAQMPRSALIRLLNLAPGLQTGADLSVIAGDVKADSWLGTVKFGLLDRFYKGDHDLVVNTGSMYGGVKRSAEQARFALDDGPEVSHFRYFSNATTVKLVHDGLLRATGAAAAGYRPIAELAKHEEPAWRSAVQRSAEQGPRPMVVLLPGTMGSELIVDGDRVWLDIGDLAFGGLSRLDIDAAPQVQTGDPIEDFYGDFIVYLSRTHRVEPFTYDWRQSLLTLADWFADFLKPRIEQCERDRQPLRIAAHSMGGLVVRAVIANDKHKELWNRLRALPDSRFVMFGTPNAGSYEAVRWVTGRNSTLGKLALLDLTKGRNGVLEIVTRFPGSLELLPFGPNDADFGKRKLWEDLKRAVNESWEPPAASDLGKLRDAWNVVRSSPVDPQFMRYVAGCAPQTVCSYHVTPQTSRPLIGVIAPTIEFAATRQGDGTVTWESGRLDGVQVWYVEDTPHDALMANESAFAGYLDLLATGKTTRLSQTVPSGMRSATDAAPKEEPLPAEMPEYIPGGEDTAAYLFGLDRRAVRKRRLPRVKVSVRHADLAYARYPVCVGHYQGDTIVSAEAALDRRLDSALSNRLKLGVYPGRLDTNEVFINENRNVKPGGAIVIGLGQVGELTPGALESGCALAMLNYALKVADWLDDRFGATGAPRSARVSTLLIGTGAGNMSVRDSISAILRGVQSANRRLLDTGFDDRVLLDEVEFLELYHDVAIQAARALDEVLLDGELARHFEWPREGRVVREGRGGRRRVTFDEAAEWWRRLDIRYDETAGTLRFTSFGDRARAEESLVSGQMRLAEEFIEKARTTTGSSHEIARTLFEMLLPNRLKEMAPRQYDVVLLVDGKSAVFPWELLEDRSAASGRPLAVSAGMLRQLKTPEFRPHPAHAFESKAFVVGNPKLPPPSAGGVQFPDLPGAEREAEEVARSLRRANFKVTALIRDTADNILTGLHGDAYQILHLAGHGVHELVVKVAAPRQEEPGTHGNPLPAREQRISGMVIGKDMYLTAGDVEQMRWVPELVFVNCCHLGRTDPPDPAWSRYNGLAANLAVQFINMGVKAVVAAGWAVDDGAALAFARSFYDHMLKGSGFGEAVRAAREEIYSQFAHVNTWGAYQCYGDPDFRLRENSGARRKPPPVYCSAQELVADLDNFVDAARCQEPDIGDWERRIQAVRDRIPLAQREEWLQRADVSAALGLLYGELGEYERALQHLEVSIAANDAELPLRALEQRANFRVRLAFRQWLSARDQRPGKAAAAAKKMPRPRFTGALLEDVEAAIRELDWLIDLRATPERCSLLGGACKRRAWMSEDPGKRRVALAQMASNYKRALDLAEQSAGARAAAKSPDAAISKPARRTIRGRKADRSALTAYTAPDPYPLTNWLAALAVLNWYGDASARGWIRHVAALCPIAIEQAKAEEERDPDFWNSVVMPDCRLLEALARNDLGDNAIQEIAEGYRLAAKRGSSAREIGSVLEQLDFLIEMVRDAPRGKAGLRKSLEALRKAIG